MFQLDDFRESKGIVRKGLDRGMSTNETADLMELPVQTIRRLARKERNACGTPDNT